ncbi:uncharacterized protein LTR77_004691 [Saxophila tyrrhenica]|uniref:SMODS and SLOG-associating 2TM effector domain-containing protein n=1 Tax=Saxophila tyrrhenica TaxID=1690608 RepID=A0AAV9PDB7_9PEZI|nr:hypothetical protein LTR77_004691 [Saxophila tyrrhenica]
MPQMSEKDHEDLESGRFHFRRGESADAKREQIRKQEEEQDRLASEFSEHHRRYGRSELKVFQTLVGIHFTKYGGGGLVDRQKPPASVWRDILRPSKAAEERFRNRGLYDRALSQDMKNRVMYSVSNYLIVSLYLLQILVAATLTALAAGERSSNTALTVLGAINTVVAGVLAWLTGQGMPVRFRRARDQYREVVKAIEASERVFATIDFLEWGEGERPHPIQERDRLERLYEEAREDQVANYPHAQNGPSQNQAQAKAVELEDKVAKHKEQKKEYKKELKALQKELDGVRRGVVDKVEDAFAEGSDAVRGSVASTAVGYSGNGKAHM